MKIHLLQDIPTETDHLIEDHRQHLDDADDIADDIPDEIEEEAPVYDEDPTWTPEEVDEAYTKLGDDTEDKNRTNSGYIIVLLWLLFI